MSVELRKQVLILGSGFGGIYTALQLEKALSLQPYVEVTLINWDNFSSLRPCCARWPPVTSISSHIANPVRKLLRDFSMATYGPSTFYQALTMKLLGDAIRLLNQSIDLLGRADFECAVGALKDSRTVVVAGG